jgi:hypothetical protein
MKTTIMIVALCLSCFAASAGERPPYHANGAPPGGPHINGVSPMCLMLGIC